MSVAYPGVMNTSPIIINASNAALDVAYPGVATSSPIVHVSKARRSDSFANADTPDTGMEAEIGMTV